MTTDQSGPVWIPRATVGYDDWLECLGVFLLQFTQQPQLGYEDWAIIHGALRGVGCTYTRAARSNDPGLRSAEAKLLMRGIITQLELVAHPGVLASMVANIWDAAASHRVAGDWLGHLAAAAVLGGVAPRSVATMLLLHYRWMFRSNEVENLWSRNPDDPGEEVPTGLRLRESMLLHNSIVTSGQSDSDDWPVDDRREGNRLLSFHRLSFQGDDLCGPEVVEAAHTVRLSGDWPAIVAASTPWMPRLLLVPVLIEEARLEMLDLTAGQRIVLRRVENTATGWLTTDF